MTELRVVWRVAMGALRESFSSIRPYFVALLALVLMRMASSDICQLCAQYGEKHFDGGVALIQSRDTSNSGEV